MARFELRLSWCIVCCFVIGFGIISSNTQLVGWLVAAQNDSFRAEKTEQSKKIIMALKFRCSEKVDGLPTRRNK